MFVACEKNLIPIPTSMMVPPIVTGPLMSPS